MKLIPLSEAEKVWFKKKGVREAYEALAPEFELADMLIEARIRRKMTQTALAKKIGTKQSAIARLESGSSNPTIEFLWKVAKALNMRLRMSMK